MNQRNLCKVLAALLCYPDEQLRQAAGDLAEVVQSQAELPAAHRRDLLALINELVQCDPFELEARYVDCFDRGRSTSLHLFEHVHGDSRERGPAMVDLAQTYEQAGLYLDDSELPDYLPVVLEFVSTQPYEVAQGFLAEMAHILNAIHTALVKRESPYAAVLATTLWLAGEAVAPVALPEEKPMDEDWQEPEAFGGCTSAGQSRPDQPQPIHIVRNASGRSGASA